LNLLRCAFRNLLAVIEHMNSMREAHDYPHVVLNDQQGDAELRDVNITNSTSLATKGEAQAYLDTSNSVTHGNVTNIALNQNGDGSWNFLTKTPTPRKTPTSMTLQYSIEKTDMLFPILVGGIVKLEYANRFNFAGFSFGVGFKFPVY
jgi:hypothetical protein